MPIACRLLAKAAQQASNFATTTSSSTAAAGGGSSHLVQQAALSSNANSAPPAVNGTYRMHQTAPSSSAQRSLRAALDAIYPPAAAAANPGQLLQRAAALFLAGQAPNYRASCAAVAAAADAALGNLGLKARQIMKVIAADPNACVKFRQSHRGCEVYLKLDVRKLMQQHKLQQAMQQARAFDEAGAVLVEVSSDIAAAAGSASSSPSSGLVGASSSAATTTSSSSSSSSSTAAGGVVLGSSSSSSSSYAVDSGLDIERATSSSSSSNFSAAFTSYIAFPKVPKKVITIVNPATKLPIIPPPLAPTDQPLAPAAAIEPAAAAAAAAAGPAWPSAAYVAVQQAFNAAALALMPPAVADIAADVIYVPDNDDDEQQLAAEAVQPVLQGQMTAEGQMAVVGTHQQLLGSAKDKQLDGLQWMALQQQVPAQWWA
jgi:hypothetical protein